MLLVIVNIIVRFSCPESVSLLDTAAKMVTGFIEDSLDILGKPA
jgi:hypothetical protein